METNGYTLPKTNVFDIYSAVFGYRAIPFPTKLAESKSRLFPDAKERLSKLGAAILGKDKNGNEAFCPVKIEYNGRTFDLPYSTIAVTMQKNIQKTVLIGRQGSVKELIQTDDFQITINGIILGATDQNDEDYMLPQADLEELNDLFKINNPVRLKNAFIEIFMQSDNSVVIESMDLPDMRGIDGAQAYSIRLSSDTILELEE